MLGGQQKQLMNSSRCLGQRRRDRHPVELPQRVGVEEPAAVEADPGEGPVVEDELHDVGEPGLARGLEHAAIPERVADAGAGLVVRRAVGELVVAAVGLVDPGDRLLVLRAVGRGAVEQGPAGAGDVHLARDDVVPDLEQGGEQGLVAGLGVHVGGAGVEVVGADGVADGLVLAAEGYAVLVVIGAVGGDVAHVEERAGQRQVSRVARGAEEFDDPHVVRRADGVAGELRRRVPEGADQEIGRLDGDVEQVRLAGGPVVDACGGHQMPEVVHLEVEAVLEGPRVASVAGGDQDRRVQVAVGALGQGDDADGLVHLPVELRIPRDGVDGGGGLEPLVEVAVVPAGAAVPSLGQPGRDPEVVEELARLRTLHDLPHLRDHRLAARREAVGPEAAGPSHVGQADAAHHHMRAQ